MFRFPFLPGNEKPQSGDRIQPGVQTPGYQIMPQISALKGRREGVADGVANPVRLGDDYSLSIKTVGYAALHPPYIFGHLVFWKSLNT